MACFIKNLVSLLGGQALIPQVNGQAGKRTQLSGEGLCTVGLRALLTGEVQWVSDHDAGHGIAATKAGQRAEIVPLVAPPLERQHRLRRKAQFVGHGHANAAVADVESQVTRMLG